MRLEGMKETLHKQQTLNSQREKVRVSSSDLKYMPNRAKNVCMKKSADVQSNVIPNSQKVKLPQISIN